MVSVHQRKLYVSDGFDVSKLRDIVDKEHGKP